MIRFTFASVCLLAFLNLGCAAYEGNDAKLARELTLDAAARSAVEPASTEVGAAPAAAPAGGSGASEQWSPGSATTSQKEAAKRNEENKHHVALSLGDTSEGFGQRGFTLGIDYEYHLREKWGIGGIIDHAWGDVDSWVVAAQGIYHPVPHLGLVAAPGYSFRSGRDDSFLLRTGMFYEFELQDGFSIAPALFLDVLEGGERSMIIGVEFGYGF